jgi:hypothetical protein
MEEITYPYKGFNSAHEIIEESQRTGKQICDILGTGLPLDWSQDQLIEAYTQEKCTIGYLAARLHVSIVEARKLVEDNHKCIPSTDDIITNCSICKKRIVQ